MKGLRETLEEIRAAERRVLVVGLGVSGIQGARLLANRGLKVTVIEKKAEQLFRAGASATAGLSAIQEIGVQVVFGVDGEGVAAHLAQVGLAVLSPGVSLESSIVGALRRHGIPCVAELEVVTELHNGGVLVVTGSTGKSTTAALIDHIMKGAGVRSTLCGTRGIPVVSNGEASGSVQGEGSLLVVEASSYQLEACSFLKPQVSVVVTISEDHLERHGSLERYAAAKERVLRLQTADDLAVVNADDPIVVSMSRRCRASKAVFGAAPPSELSKLSSTWAHISYLTSPLGEIIVSHRGVVEEYSTERVQILGRHNRYAIAAAILSARHMGVSQEVVQAGLESFQPLQHRLEVFHTVGGQVVINDSRSTNVAATVAALTTVLEHYPSSRVALMIGGLSKAGAWSPLLTDIASQSSRRDISVICFGRDAALLASHCRAAGVSHVVAERLEDATSQALSMTAGGGVVLLSPGCASFDEYADFEHRGAAFKNFVRSCFRQEERTSL